MDVFYITFRSITAAQRGERTLKEAGMSAAMQRTPRWMQDRGCGYCLKLSGRKGPQAVQLLRQRSVSFTKVYAAGAAGELQEMKL